MELIEGPDTGCNEPAAPTHVDLRSAEKAANRLRKQKQKYYAYRGVHPSWVGRQYYALTLVSEEPVAFPKNKNKNKSKKTKRLHPTAVVETEHEALLDELLTKPYSLTSMTLPGSIHQAIAEAHAAGYTTTHPDHKHETSTAPADNAYADTDTDTDTIDAPMSLARLTETWHYPSKSTSNLISPPPSPSLPGTNTPRFKLKLKVKTWTKRDNFEHKEYFSAGPDRRHSKSRRVREWRSQHCEMQRLERTARQRGAAGTAMRKEAEEEMVVKRRDWNWSGNGDVTEYYCATYTRPLWPGRIMYLEELGVGEADAEIESTDTDTARRGLTGGSWLYPTWHVDGGGDGDSTAAVDEQAEIQVDGREDEGIGDEWFETLYMSMSMSVSLLESLLASSEIVVVSQPQPQPRSEVDVDDDSGSIDIDFVADLADVVADSDIDIEWDVPVLSDADRLCSGDRSR
ncbi:hypothetical protein LTR70_004777 [Exophiala xenobiotica]|uniref:Uncharacterized protein n=1 Tax=Lithohypha guttulata TaxID=1690604 RepID=A0ABR0KCD2_9EURO|nr:hypothetical protein LTR24_004269 [Lithohypha guttulata]KAK5319867.1 hypothetical protein LTR70_004777 [Exophiala xenobiotica]